MKKLITILLSVLCLFSIVGINVSAEGETKNVYVEHIALFEGDCPEINIVEFTNSDGTTTRGQLEYFDDEGNGDYVYINSLDGTIRTPKMPFKEGEEVIILFDSSINVHFQDYYQACIGTTPTPISYKKDGNQYVIDDGEGSKIYNTYSFTIFEPAKLGEEEEIIVDNVNMNAGDQLSKYDKNTPVSKAPVFIDGEFHYITESNFKKIKSLEDISKYEEHVSKLAYGTKYYFAVLFEINPSYVTQTFEGKVKINGLPAAEFKLGQQRYKAFYITFETIPDQKSVTLKYSVGEEYKWMITNNIGEDVTNKEIWIGQNTPDKPLNTEVNVEVSELNLAANNILKISVESKYGYNMVPDGVVGNQAKYQITHETAKGESWEENNVVLLTDKLITEDDPVISKGIFNWINAEKEVIKAPTRAGNYEDVLTFTAEIKEMPKKGDKVYFDLDKDGIKDTDEIQTTVLKIDGAKAYVYAGDVATNPDHKFHEDIDKQQTEIEGKSYLNYAGSDVDVYLNGDGFYNSLPGAIKKAIAPSEYELDAWQDASSSSYDFHYSFINWEKKTIDYYLNKVSFTETRKINRNVVVISLQDLVDYLGKESTAEKAKELFLSSGSIWFRTNTYSSSSSKRMYEIFNFAAGGGISTESVNANNAVSAPVCFTIDLSKINFEIIK